MAELMNSLRFFLPETILIAGLLLLIVADLLLLKVQCRRRLLAAAITLVTLVVAGVVCALAPVQMSGGAPVFDSMIAVDAFARYRIINPLKFYQSVGIETVAEQRLSSVVNSALRRVLGNVTLLAVLSEERAKVMSDIKAQVNAEITGFGVEIIDVRMRRADLPEETSQSIFARMRSEREREAAEARAQGQEQSQQIRSRADRERTVLLAEAQRDAQKLRGEGDNQALRIISDAMGRDASFYTFYRTLEAYRNAFKTEDTTLVLSPTGDFFRYFNDMNPAPAAAR